MLAILVLLAVVLFFLEPWVKYFRDPKKLRQFPNAAPLAGIYNLSFVIQRWRGFHSKEIYEAHTRHPILRLGPNTVSFSSPAAIRAIYGHSTPCVKGGSYERNLGKHPGLIDVIDKESHAFKRRILSHAFATRNLETWESKVTDKVRKFLIQFDRLSDPHGDAAPVDIREWFGLFTVDAIADLALSMCLGCLERGDDRIAIRTEDGEEKYVEFRKSMHASRRAIAKLLFTDWYRPLRKFLEMFPNWFRLQWDLGKGYSELVRHAVQQRIERQRRGEELDDLSTCLLQDRKGKPRNAELAEICGDMENLLDAGSDTTSIALTHVLYFLIKTPSALTSLRDEIDANAVFEDGIATHKSVQNLPYLRACIDESLRLIPPVSTGLHRLTPSKGYSIDGHWIAGNTIVVVPIYTAHRNPELFQDPDEYKPERWLRGDSKTLRSSFIPFSEGARGCIGRNITYIEQSVLLASLVRRFDFQFTDPTWELTHEEAFLVWPESMPVFVRQRHV